MLRFRFINRGLDMSGIKPIITLLVVLLIAGLACSLPGRGTPTVTPTLIPTLDAQVLEGQLATAVAGFNGTGPINLSLNEQQITSLVAQALAQQPDIPVTEPQVTLQNGQMILTGNVEIGSISTEVKVVFEPTVQNGQFRVNILSANFGSLPLPDSALQQISDTMNENLTRFISANGRSIEVESVAIADGLLTLTGTAR
jgi:hypothetical protein